MVVLIAADMVVVTRTNITVHARVIMDITLKPASKQLGLINHSQSKEKQLPCLFETNQYLQNKEIYNARKNLICSV